MTEFKEFERRFKFIVSIVSRFKPALNLNRVLDDLNRGSNSLNSISGVSLNRTVDAWFRIEQDSICLVYG